MAPAMATATTAAAAGDDGAHAATDELTAQLSSRVFHAGGIVRGVVQLRLRRSAAEIALVVAAHMHAHVTVDSNLLTLPLVSLVPPAADSGGQQTQPQAEAGNASPHSLATTNASSSNNNTAGDAASAALPLPLPDVRGFAGDGGACIFQSAATTLFSGAGVGFARGAKSSANASESESTSGDLRCEREFALALPATACPTFRGAAARVLYVLTVTALSARAGSKPVSVHLPFEVYAPEFFFRASALESADEYAAAQMGTRTGVGVGVGVGVGGHPVAAAGNRSTTATSGSSSSGGDGSDRSPSQQQQQQAAADTRKTRSVSVGAVPVGVRTGQELPFELRPSLMHGRVETEALRKAQTSIFTIGKDNSHLVRFLLTKQSYQPGDVLLGVFDFARAALPCYEVAATLCLEETLSTMSLDPSRVVSSKEFGAFREFTGGAVHTNVQFCVPHDAVPTIRTDLVSFQWLLRFEFTAGVATATATATAAVAVSASASGPSTPLAMQRQTFRWQVPVVVRPVALVERSPCASIPHKLLSGSRRSVRLA